MKVTTIKPNRSIPAGLEFELSDLTVLTGKNGSGKSHLLEAINNGDAKIFDDGKHLDRIIYIPFGGLNPQVTEQGTQQEIVNTYKNFWTNVQALQQYVRAHTANGGNIDHATANWLKSNVGVSKAINNLCRKIEASSVLDITESDVLKFVRFSELSNSSLFNSQFAQIFKAYNVRLQKNEYNEFLHKVKGRDCKYLTSEEFEVEYGPKPWVLVNDILRNAGLSYKVSDPESIELEADFILRLVDVDRDLQISVNDLSTGEKVLMSLALAIYNSNDGGSKTDVLLIDEPDAALHPHFSKLLINTINDSIVNLAKTKVILTTHSPSTVAMCPYNSVYQISKDSKAPEMISVARALEVLTEGIPHLKVSMESRLQVFVESKYDVAYYERMHNLLSREYKYLKTPLFLAPHSGTSNCGDVVAISMRLHEFGNDLVRGIIDYDGVNEGKYPVFVLGAGNRYAIENYLLDPIYIALALVRAAKKSFPDFGVGTINTYVASGSLSNAEVQVLVDTVFAKLGMSNVDPIFFELKNGYCVSYAKEFALMRGHDYEAKLLSTFPELNAVRNGNNESALKLGILQVIEEFPQYLSKDWHSTFASVLLEST